VYVTLLQKVITKNLLILVKVKVKQSHYKRWQALMVVGSWGSQTLNNRYMKVKRLSALDTDCLYPQEMYLVLISVRGWVNPRAIVQLEGLCQWEIPLTPSGIDPVSFRFVTHYLNRLRHHQRAPYSYWCVDYY
jgi:hypothetical protein